eukprot:gene42774-57922_t
MSFAPTGGRRKTYSRLAVFKKYVRLEYPPGNCETSSIAGRVPAASTDVLIACDLLVAASPEGLALFSKKTTRAFGNADFSPTADFVTNRDVRFDTAGMARKVAAATKSYDACPSQALAEGKLGDGIYANMIMLGQRLRGAG